MQQRRERQGVTGFATGFDVLSPDEQRKRAERAARYGASLEGGGGGKAVVGGELAGDPAGALVVDVLEPRRDALGDALVRHECVYVYGVDHLSTKECMSYFGDYAPVFVEWINDSSCNVVFADAFTAKRAMYGKARGGMVWWGVASRPHIPRVRLSDAPSRRPTNQHQGVPETTTPATEAPDAGAPAAADEAPMEGDAPTAPIAPEEDGAGGDAVMTTGSGPHPECFFFKGADFVKPGGIRVPLTFRLATTDDVKPDGKVTSRYLWCGGKRPGPPPKRSQNSGRKRRRREVEGGDEEAVEAEAVPDIDLREALKKRRELAAGEAGAMETGEEGKAEEGVEAAAAVEAATVPLVLPPGDLRAKLAAVAAPEVVEDPIPVDAE